METIQKSKKTNYNFIDLMKLLLAIYVITNHSGLFADSLFLGRYIIVEVLARFITVYFLIVSAYFLFKKMDFSRTGCRKQNLTALKKHFLRVLYIYLFWSLIYAVIILTSAYAENGISSSDVLDLFENLFINGTFYHMWFFLALLISLPAVYFLLRYTSLKFTLIIAGFLYVICVLGNGYYFFGKEIPILSGFYNAYFTIFNDTINGLFYGIPMAALGALFAQKKAANRAKLYGILFILSVILFSVEGGLLYTLGLIPPQGKHAFIMVVPAGVFAFLFTLKVNFKDRPIYFYARKSSILIYVAHPLFIIIWMKLANVMGVASDVLSNVVCFVFAVFCSLAFSFVVIKLSRRRRLKWIKLLY